MWTKLETIFGLHLLIQSKHRGQGAARPYDVGDSLDPQPSLLLARLAGDDIRQLEVSGTAACRRRTPAPWPA